MAYSGNETPRQTKLENKKLYLVMNKPQGYVCSAVSDSHKTVYSLLPQELQNLVQNAKRGSRLHTVGRLDCDTKGLLLFTTDGNFSNYLTRHENGITKTYKVTLEKPSSMEEQQKIRELFKAGITLPAEKKAPEQFVNDAEAKFTSSYECSLTIKQGLFHQVRRMFLAVNNKVVLLERTAIGNFSLPKELLPGQYRYLTENEISLLYKS